MFGSDHFYAFPMIITRKYMTVENQYLSSFVSSFMFNAYNLGEDKMEQQTPFRPKTGMSGRVKAKMRHCFRGLTDTDS